MKKELGKEYPLAERKAFLDSNADSIEEIDYMKSFDPDEIQQQKDMLAESSIKANTLEEELKDIKESYKERMKPHIKQIQECLKHIKEGAELVNEECFKFIDQEEGMVGFYNSFGDLVQVRQIKPEERQKKLFKFGKTGTNE